MSATEISLIAVTLAFTGLVLWVYWPSRRQRLESLGNIPLDDDDREAAAGPRARQETNKEKQL